MAFKWHFGKSRRSKYAKRQNYIRGSGKKAPAIFEFMHRRVIGFPNAKYVDHINGDTLDNRKSNLRTCSNVENCRNRPRQSNNKSGFKGVSAYRKGFKKWRAVIFVNGKQISLGYFHDKRTAALAYNNAAEKHFGEFAKLNELRGIVP